MNIARMSIFINVCHKNRVLELMNTPLILSEVTIPYHYNHTKSIQNKFATHQVKCQNDQEDKLLQINNLLVQFPCNSVKFPCKCWVQYLQEDHYVHNYTVLITILSCKWHLIFKCFPTFFFPQQIPKWMRIEKVWGHSAQVYHFTVSEQ